MNRLLVTVILVVTLISPPTWANPPKPSSALKIGVCSLTLLWAGWLPTLAEAADESPESIETYYRNLETRLLAIKADEESELLREREAMQEVPQTYGASRVAAVLTGGALLFITGAVLGSLRKRKTPHYVVVPPLRDSESAPKSETDLEKLMREIP
jgi:hypothetical protein